MASQLPAKLAVAPATAPPRPAIGGLGGRLDSNERTAEIEGLFDLKLKFDGIGGFADSESGRTLTSEQVAELVRRRGGGGQDVRILLPGAERSAAVLADIAEILQVDLLVPPAGTDVRYLTTGGGAQAPVPVDRTSGQPVDWLIVQPASRKTRLPGWFDLVGGLVVPRTGLVTLPLPDGVALTSRKHFVQSRAAVAALARGHAALTTVAVPIAAGKFVVGEYSGASTLQDGQELAATLSSLPLYGADVRLWFVWPGEREEQRRLADNLRQLAETAGATIWAPPVGGRAHVVATCRDLGVVDRGGRVSRWEAYGLAGAEARFTSDPDGRLMRRGGFVVLAGQRSSPDALVPGGDPFTIELSVLDDGRPAALCKDGTLHAVGPALMRDLLIAAGWRGQDVALVASVPEEQADSLRSNLHALGSQLHCQMLLAPSVASPIPPSRSQVDASRAGVELVLTPLDTQPSRVESKRMAVESAPAIARTNPVAETRPVVGTKPVVGTNSVVGTNPVVGTKPVGEAKPALVETRPLPVVLPDPPAIAVQVSRPAVVAADRRDGWHGLRWLPDRLKVNAEGVEVFVACQSHGTKAAAEGIPSPDLFLLGRLEPSRLAQEVHNGHVLRLRVKPGGAIDVAASAVSPPPELRHRLTATDTFLLPAGWLRHSTITGSIAVIDGVAGRLEPIPLGQVTIACVGARHGADGLPNEAPTWPRGRLRAARRVFALLPLRSDELAGGWVRVRLRSPKPEPDTRLVHLSVGRGRAIDLVAAYELLAPLESVRSRAVLMASHGIDLVLPRRSFSRVTVKRVFESVDNRWRRCDVGMVSFATLVGADD